MATPSKDPAGEPSHPANELAIPHDANFDIDKIRVVVSRTGDDDLIELNLRVRFIRNRQQLFFQLSADGLPLRPEGFKKAANAKF